MKKNIIYLLLMVVVLAQGCVLSESHSSVETIYAPKLDVNFEVDDNFSLYSNGRVLLYDPKGVLCVDTTIISGGLGGQINLVHGVTAGTYTMVSFCNIDGIQFNEVTINKSKIGQLRVVGNVIGGSKMFMQTGQFELRRGDPQVSKLQSKPLYYNFVLKLTHIDQLTEKPNKPWVELLGISNVFDAQGNKIVDRKQDVRLPDLTAQPNQDLQTECTLVKFNGDDGVKIRVKELVKDVIETVVIDPATYIDPDANTPQDLVIEMRYKAYSFELIVNDWILGEYEFAELGG